VQKVTRVTATGRNRTTVLPRILAISVFLTCAALAQTPAPSAGLPQTAIPSATLKLYHDLRSVGLDSAHLYRAREIAIDREDFHLYLTNGTLAFTKAVDGRVTGALFEGDGEILLNPPDQVERQSLGLFTGAGVLTESFTGVYLRFNDDTYKELLPALQPIEGESEPMVTPEATVETMAETDALRLLCSFTSSATIGGEAGDRYLHARVAGTHLGTFDIVYDALSEEQISVGKLTVKNNASYYDIWMSFPARRARAEKNPSARVIDPWKSFLSVRIVESDISARLLPPEEIEADATLQLHVKNGGQKLLFFELARALKVSEVTSNGRNLEFIQNESLEGSELARRGNDEIAVVFPDQLKAGSDIRVKLKYRGPVMTQAGTGLLYVGSRGTWYPNRGMAMGNFKLEFRWPSQWTLVATGKRESLESRGNELVGRWVSEAPIPLAGFNLGIYSKKSARAGNVLVESYATTGMEYSFPKPQSTGRAIQTPIGRTNDNDETAIVLPPAAFNPAEAGQTVAEQSAKAIEQFSKWFGPFPYPSLALTQFPGNYSQGWPGLVFLSGTVFLPTSDKARLHMDPFSTVVYDEIMGPHETAHQWWGNLVSWHGYRDQWWVEALANYSALMLLEQNHPNEFKLVMDRYREDLLKASTSGKPYMQAGPVMLGLRLSSSEFPSGYLHISYGRGTWLIHMLRGILRDSEKGEPSKSRVQSLRNPDDGFLHAMHTIRDRYAYKEMTTAEMMKIFEEEMPESLKFEGKKSLQWFTENWLNGIAIPTLKLTDVKISTAGSPHATFLILQQDTPGELVTLVPIYAVTADNRRVPVGRVFADGAQSSFRLSVPAGTKRLLMDPFETVLRRK
jgi:hypothetical protein